MWNQALTNEELASKFKAIAKEYHHTHDISAVGESLKELKCPYFVHEFVRKAIIHALETVSTHNFIDS
jgi:hypothetical protein